MKTFIQFVEGQDVKKTSWTRKEAKKIGDEIGIDWNNYDIEEFRQGLAVEKEHDTDNPKTDVAESEIDLGKIALAHLEELKDYYTRLKAMEKKGKEESKYD